jgi:hypothetical protein
MKYKRQQYKKYSAAVDLLTSVSNDRRPILEALKLRRSENSNVLGPRRSEELRTTEKTEIRWTLKQKDQSLEV